MTESLPYALATEVNENEESYLSERLSAIVQFSSTAEPLAEVDPARLAEIQILIPFIHSHVGKAEMDAMPHLQLIATRSTGFDHIDLAEAKARGIVVAFVPGYGERAVAECTFALMLALARKLAEAERRTSQSNFSIEGLLGFDLYGKKLGVIGAGAIGLHTIRIARGFGMEVMAYDARQNNLLAEVIGFRYTSLDELFTQSDIVTLHAPSIPETYHIINRESLSKMKRGSLLINTARGSLVDSLALSWALDAGILAGAGLDVLEGEEYLQREEELLNPGATEENLRLQVTNHRLQHHPNVIITPHIAFYTVEALRRILDSTIENVQSFLEGNVKYAVKMEKKAEV
jgi:D-lactate dehydrogenase